jgi:hypothetical protein
MSRLSTTWVWPTWKGEVWKMSPQKGSFGDRGVEAQSNEEVEARKDDAYKKKRTEKERNHCGLLCIPNTFRPAWYRENDLL